MTVYTNKIFSLICFIVDQNDLLSIKFFYICNNLKLALVLLATNKNFSLNKQFFVRFQLKTVFHINVFASSWHLLIEWSIASPHLGTITADDAHSVK